MAKKKKRCVCKKPGPKRRVGRPKGSGKKKTKNSQKGRGLVSGAAAAMKFLAPIILPALVEKMVGGKGMRLLGRR
jgi:hypothetical protein